MALYFLEVFGLLTRMGFTGLYCEVCVTIYLSSVQRIIRCGGPVEDDMANIIVAQLLYLDAIDPTKVKTKGKPFCCCNPRVNRACLCFK